MADDVKKIIERESKWQKRWRDARVFVPKNDGSKPRFYNLVEFPFLSGAGLHAGHLLIYTGMDVMSRFRRHLGYDVLYPMGFDALGIAAEHYATKIGKHPADVAAELKKSYADVIDSAGWSVNPETRVATSAPFDFPIRFISSFFTRSSKSKSFKPSSNLSAYLDRAKFHCNFSFFSITP